MNEKSTLTSAATLRHWDTVSNFESFEVLMLCLDRDPYASGKELEDCGVILNSGPGRRIKELLQEAVANGWAWCYERLSAAAGLPESKRRVPIFMDVPLGIGGYGLESPSTGLPVLISGELECRYLDILLEDCDHELFHQFWDKAMDRATQNPNETFARESVGAWLRSIRWSIGYDFSLPGPNFKLENKSDPLQQIAIGATQPFHSDRLTALIQASRKFWANADELDKTTHRTNAIVAQWLVSQGFSESLAKHGAAIIRPRWADTGRPPEK